MKTLALVVPCHNEAKRLDVDAFVRAAEEWPWISFCFVDDGSTDSTAELLAHMANLSPSMHAIYINENVGKAEAVRRGVLHVCSDSGADCVGPARLLRLRRGLRGVLGRGPRDTARGDSVVHARVRGAGSAEGRDRIPLAAPRHGHTPLGVARPCELAREVVHQTHSRRACMGHAVRGEGLRVRRGERDIPSAVQVALAFRRGASRAHGKKAPAPRRPGASACRMVRRPGLEGRLGRAP